MIERAAASAGLEFEAGMWSKFRDVYVAEDDIRFIKAAGFNTVRVPLNWGLFIAPGVLGVGPLL
jgi:hypothetical protein